MHGKVIASYSCTTWRDGFTITKNPSDWSLIQLWIQVQQSEGCQQHCPPRGWDSWNQDQRRAWGSLQVCIENSVSSFYPHSFLGKPLGTLRLVQRSRELPTTISSSQLLTQRKCSSQSLSLSSGPHCCCGTCVTKSLFCSLLNSLDLDENTKAVLVENIQRKLTQQAVKIRADFECSCFTYEGIDAVKEALRAGMHTSHNAWNRWKSAIAWEPLSHHGLVQASLPEIRKSRSGSTSSPLPSTSWPAQLLIKQTVLQF